ncbi:unnamed protein product [Notodromas monacha]|uniref:ZN622/Rei1/Reh1 zinc finger C2H2-type domain-containing protein n=1 Tax=Notodromas monacha TaxID=399045 RepID=A0A7R9BLL5_9CRUS|nr:unnamed protein product [Notodromas monacha]CAG0916661.1 unnamed protein product [Notodromas monacha]
MILFDNDGFITSMKRYSNYWKKRFEGHELKEFCSVIETKSKADQGVSNTYFLLCDTLPEDESLRSELQAERRAKALQDYEEERDRNVLKEHMRKKMHRKLNPKNKVYDKFYLVNYLELGKNWEDIAAEADEEYEEDQDWGDWVSDAPRMSCLFCSVVEPSGEALFSHMKDAHGFDFVSGAEVKRLAFHDKVKLVNYFRRYYFPTVEDDDLLWVLEDINDDDL